MTVILTPKYKIIPSSVIPNGLIDIEYSSEGFTPMGTMVSPKKDTSVGGMQAGATTLQQGSGNDVFRISPQGIHLGGANFEDAPFSVDMQGNLTATRGTFSGELSAPTGIIGGFTIDTNSLSTGEFNTLNTLYFGSSGLSLSNVFKVTSAGVLTASSGIIGGWNIQETLLSSEISGARIELDKGNNRISIFDDVNSKVVMGYLDGLPKNDGSGNWGASNYGFWVRAGDLLSIDGDTEYISGDWIVQDDASYLVNDASDNTIIRLGTDTGEKGLFIYNTSGTQLAKFISDEVFIGEVGNSLTYDTTNGLVIEGDITATTGSIGGFDIGTDYIRDVANSFGMASTVSGSDDVRFWAGDTFANRATAPFRVTESGYLVARLSSIATYTPSSASTATLDCSTANDHRITMPAGNITIALSNVLVGQKFTVSITQDGGGGRTVTWFSTIRWSDGAVPVLSTAASKRDTFGFICTGSNTYDGFILGLYI
jgi:hypothetical protein